MTRYHPLADAFPLLEGPEFQELIDDINKHGLHLPVVMHEGMILDGRNRWRACQELGIAHREVKFTGEDAAAYVWSTNAVRRQLSPSQRALAAAKLARATAGGQPGNRNAAKAKGVDDPAAPPVRSIEDPREMTTAEAAKLTGASERTIRAAKGVLREGAPEVVAAVEKGELPVYTAERLAKAKTAEEQAEIVTTMTPEQIAEVVPDRRHHRAAPAVPGGFQEPTGGGLRPSAQRGRPGPVHQLARQMGLRELTMIKGVYQDWKDQSEHILSLDRDELYGFVRELRDAKTAYTRLITLIEKTVSESAETTGETGDQQA
jgi:ParB-like chromosome segregation protein Spo0J